MPPQLKAMLARLQAYVAGFSTAQKTIAIIGVAGLVLGGIALTSWLGKPTMAPLFSGLQAADASKVTDQLKTDGVQFELTDGGATIMVPQDQVYAERIKAAAAGLPSSKSNTGYSLLDNMGVTSSEFQQNVTYQRAMEGELANTIGAMDGVKLATVKLAIPKDSVFTATKADPKASVFVETNPGTTLTADQVQAIVHLTSASIDGLTPANVSVVDSSGNTLSAVGVGTVGGASKQAGDYEKTTTGNIQAMLDRVLGPGNATVAVSADMDPQSGTKVDETFTQPTSAPALSETNDKQSYTGTGGPAAGVLGPDNIAVPGGSASGSAGSGGNGTYTSDKSTKDNAVNKTTQTTNIPAGVLKRQTVSVAVNSAYTGANLNQIQNLVSSAAGINTARGDVVTVENVAFDQTAAKNAQAALAQAKADADAKAAMELWKNILIAAAVLLAAVLALFLYARKNRRQSRELVDLGERLEPTVALPAPETVALSVPAMPVREVVPMELPPLPEEDIDTQQKRAQIEALAAGDPDRTASFLRGMMDDRASV
ncbi:flagellar M-ring protein FliF [Paenarthrobacter sp. DKR-5]|uniref:flagellar basal-body MS-ring/collar protein FliF n=1 Tax=Paenarthrobacter sp. DKR-5 TaxID=2835535 RepID=UPI001BDD3F31|nr:flagellar basal-body MS-ring/collar protein FliF [Paenarthrobacter sp. DKR-5]MBT1002797.1 flagellar M-ring protein FliF [Paenarthrobacter sp. DKR-5]